MPTSNILLVSFYSDTSLVDRFIHSLKRSLQLYQQQGHVIDSNQDCHVENLPRNGLPIDLYLRTRYYAAQVSLFTQIGEFNVDVVNEVGAEALIVLLDISSNKVEQNIIEDLKNYIIPYLNTNFPCIRILAVVDTMPQSCNSDSLIESDIGNKLFHWAVTHNFEFLYPFKIEICSLVHDRLLRPVHNASNDSSMSTLINTLHCHTWRSMVRIESVKRHSISSSVPSKPIESSTLSEETSEEIADREKADSQLSVAYPKDECLLGETNIDCFDQLLVAVQEVRQRALLPTTSDHDRRQAATDVLMRLVDMLE